MSAEKLLCTYVHSSFCALMQSWKEEEEAKECDNMIVISLDLVATMIRKIGEGTWGLVITYVRKSIFVQVIPCCLLGWVSKVERCARNSMAILASEYVLSTTTSGPMACAGVMPHRADALLRRGKPVSVKCVSRYQTMRKRLRRTKEEAAI